MRGTKKMKGKGGGKSKKLDLFSICSKMQAVKCTINCARKIIWMRSLKKGLFLRVIVPLTEALVPLVISRESATQHTFRPTSDMLPLCSFITETCHMCRRSPLWRERGIKTDRPCEFVSHTAYTRATRRSEVFLRRNNKSCVYGEAGARTRDGQSMRRG